MKPVIWLGDSLDAVRAFPMDAKRGVGYQLQRVQAGMQPADSKPMRSVAPGAEEIRVRAGNAYRVLYTARFAEAIYVLHAFVKRSRKTARLDLEMARQRHRSLVQSRKAGT